MNFSKYNHLFKSEKYGFLIFNAETNSFAKLDEDLYNTLKSIEERKEDIQNLDSEVQEELTKAGILVTDPMNFFYKKRLHYYFNTFDSVNLGLAIAPTTHCNFGCPYCYEENHSPIYMTEKTEQDLVSFITSHSRVENLRITWYGGEPLLGFDSIKRILTKLKEVKTKNLKRHTMTTNGYLLDESKSLFFKENPLDAIQITIDGAKQYHDKRRVLLPNNLPTYQPTIQ